MDDLTGRRYGELVVESFSHITAHGDSFWNCVCACGLLTVVSGAHLKSGHTKSCNHPEDLTGLIFNGVEVLSFHSMSKGRSSMWLCRCTCGSEWVVRGSHLKSGSIRSCGMCDAVAPGDRYGMLTVVEKTHRKLRGYFVWLCACDCGRECSVNTHALTSEGTTSCGCKLLVDYDGVRFRSKWEVFFYMAANVKGLRPLYEPFTIKLNSLRSWKGASVRYTPDFFLQETKELVEVKGWKTQESMKRYQAAVSEGYDIWLVEQQNLESWCGCTVRAMNDAWESGGHESTLSLIRTALVGC